MESDLEASGDASKSAYSQTQDEGSSTQHSTTDVEESVARNIGNLARRLSRNSHAVGDELKAFEPEPGSHLDPQSPFFDSRAWVKALVRLSESDPKSAPSRALGVAYRNLNVFGWSSGAESQPTVTTQILNSVVSLVRKVGANQESNRVDILRDFEGVVSEGEMLLVLGPPGSGCSTLLKTLAGDTAGFKVDPSSYLNYRGKKLSRLPASFEGVHD